MVPLSEGMEDGCWAVARLAELENNEAEKEESTGMGSLRS